jgi:hypothetical protein
MHGVGSSKSMYAGAQAKLTIGSSYCSLSTYYMASSGPSMGSSGTKTISASLFSASLKNASSDSFTAEASSTGANLLNSELRN